MEQSEVTFPKWPHFDEDERQAVQAVLRSGRVNAWTGEHCRTFEETIARFCEVRHAIVMANGSVTLDAIMAALDIGDGDEVIVTPRSFIASASCIMLAGATPVFADIDPVSQNITAETVAPLITPRTRAILAVHLGGWPCDMDGLRTLADGNGLILIEDGAQAHGAALHGRPVGSLGHVASFSFCQDKIVTTGGEGGAVVTDDDGLFEKIWSFKDHGKNRTKCRSQAHPPGYRWLHDTIGTNLRMTEMQAAIGCLQYEKLPDWVNQRRRNAGIMDERLAAVSGLRLALPPDHVDHAYYKYHCFVRPERLRDGWSRDRIMEELNARGIPCMTGVCPEIYLEQAFANRPGVPTRDQRLPTAARLASESLMFQVHPTLEPAHIECVAEAVSSVMAEAVR